MPPVLKVSTKQMQAVAHDTQLVAMSALKDLLGMVGGALEHGDLPLAATLLSVLEKQCDHFDSLLMGMYYAEHKAEAEVLGEQGFIDKMTANFAEAHRKMDELVSPLDARVRAAVADMADKLGTEMKEDD